MLPQYRGLLMCLLLQCAGTPVLLASDGVLEISQACVTAGCFSGDAAGFPVTIDGSAGKNFLLTSNLVVGGADITAIQISTDGVSLDLNGFTIRGTTTCNFQPYASCSPTGSGKGVAGISNVLVKNGIVIGMGSYGLDLGFDSVVEGVRALNNGVGGIRVGPGSAVRSSTTNANNGYGLVTDFRSAIYATIATNNNLGGIKLGQDAMIRDSLMHSNGGPGIECNNACLVTANQVSGNFGGGMKAAANCGSGTMAYGGNQVSGNFVFTVSGCVAQLGQNVCNGSTGACP